MIYATGDTHGSFGRRFSKKNFLAQMKMTKDDYLIICGDFGCIWENDPENKEEQYWLKWFNERPYTLLFVDGNHDNHERLASYPVEKWNGGKVHRIRDSVFHLMRGQVFNLCGKKVFTFGGASSHDIRDGILEPDDPDIKQKIKELKRRHALYRVNHISWWAAELPTKEEMQEGIDNLRRNNNRVDYIITHCASTSTQEIVKGSKTYKADVLTDYFERIKNTVEYDKWIFGHYHDYVDVNEEETLVYDEIIKLC